MFDAEAAPLRSAAVRREEFAAYQALARERNRRVVTRLIVTGLVLLPVLVAAITAWLLTPHAYPYLAAVLAVAILGRVGSPVGKPITDRVAIGPTYIKLTAEVTRAALVACGIGVKKPEDVVFAVGDIHRDGPGHLAVVDLPPGVIAGDVIEKRERLADALRLPKTQVWPSQQ